MDSTRSQVQKQIDGLLKLFNETYTLYRMNAEMTKNKIKIIDEKISKNNDLQNRLENDIKNINEKLNLIKTD